MKGSPKAAPAASARLAGKVAWVTGAGRGLGRAIAVRLASEGALVAVTSRSVDDLRSLEGQIAGQGGSALVLAASVTDPLGIGEAASEITRSFGHLDILVNSAGISPVYTRAEELADEVWRSIIDVNLSGTFICCREAGRLMLEAGAGSIINLSSVHGSSGAGRLAAYSASKGGVEALTKALAVEWADRGVRVNCLAPGYFLTPLSRPILASERLRSGLLQRTPMGRIADPEELTGIVAFLASDEASFVTGSTYAVDGGWLAT